MIKVKSYSSRRNYHHKIPTFKHPGNRRKLLKTFLQEKEKKNDKNQ